MKPCPRCGSPVPYKSWKGFARKYCSRDCSVLARTLIDVTLVARLASYGLTTEQMELYIPATAGAIRKAMSRHRSAA